jgi:hypothetical protein
VDRRVDRRPGKSQCHESIHRIDARHRCRSSTLLTPGQVAERVIEHFDLPRFTGANPT